jgi:ABC-2 type transport system ATP-binding protein
MREVRNLIQELGQERTVMLSTHILSEAQQVCNRVLIINNGRIVAEDTPERLQARLTGAQRVAVHLGGDADGAEPVLSDISGIARVAGKQAGRLEFETVPGQDPRPEVARSLVNAGYDLLEMRSVGMSLEDIFLELTRDEPSPPEPADDAYLEEDLVDEDYFDNESFNDEGFNDEGVEDSDQDEV